MLQSVDKLLLTLERGWAGKGQYLSVLQHLGLTKSKKVVEVPNTFEYRATARTVRTLTTVEHVMLCCGRGKRCFPCRCRMQIQHLLKIETRQQYDERLAAEAAVRAGRPPLLISHPGLGPEPGSGSSPTG